MKVVWLVLIDLPSLNGDSHIAGSLLLFKLGCRSLSYLLLGCHWLLEVGRKENGRFFLILLRGLEGVVQSTVSCLNFIFTQLAVILSTIMNGESRSTTAS